MSYTITHVHDYPGDHVALQVIELAVENLTDITLLAVPPSNLMYEVYKYAIGVEIGAYVENIGATGDLKVGMVQAIDEAGDLVGFLIYLPVNGCPDACGVTYMSVSGRHRRKGIARAMVGEMLALYPHAGLSCSIEKVPYYEALGFQILDRRDNQIYMNTRNYTAAGMMGTLNVAPIYESPQVQQIQDEIVRKYGRRALVDAQKQLARSYERGQARAEKYVRERLAEEASEPR
ncbi:TPA: GNAT family N-acetyltransferase [Pseudomonas aeruginosa]|nr:GNAT family N-acetyltransferase [Pseudomonas aeruginosa]HCA5868360.1 GNAT family N-acetyltransferase [Pseudomonas aeruginosa]HCA7378896.1 GNAT family N-acetyltransferase [Pseudomonas aeruginosa]HCA7776939.1 GNAT family N-acetyltransferase [Pseudomonas aeruginosa]